MVLLVHHQQVHGQGNAGGRALAAQVVVMRMLVAVEELVLQVRWEAKDGASER